ncbi:peroxidase domain-containing protein/Tyr_Deacylase domain-containing protein [Cephalotus follicularis]|uniref:D-aminoacyl-tRNA deacylase n=1 Tax=Cephalotus follicularis TaxID=3775 RepID=A0A1Q3D448_CEPFO|nr:peroxidase domain-containing protein/Tyr_Deacylase domain-containing protein [Cephalotus follicularis]
MSVLYIPPSFLFTYLLVFSLTLLNTSSTCLAITTNATRRQPQLSIDYYAKSCSQLEQLVGSVTLEQYKEAPVSGPATIRLFFHDCFVAGCDGSILISAKPGSKLLAEKDAEDNKDLRVEGFEVIRKAKALVESKCPGVVSCADILAIAARDFVHLAGGPYYQVKKGRWDGKLSMASRVPSNIPRANSTIDQIIKLFNSKGLTIEDLVVLSGAHTIGFAHCKQFLSRLYNYHGTKQPDSGIDPRLLKALRMSCPQFGGNVDIVAPFDVTTPFLFDHAYYENLEAKLGLLASDQALFLDPRTKPIVQSLAQDKQKFFQAFSAAMDKMGSIGVKTGTRLEMVTNNTNIICHVSKFDGKMNFNHWNIQMDTFFKARDLYICVTNEVPKGANDYTKRRYSNALAMRAVVQRVTSASVDVEGRIVSEIGPGLLALVGIHDSDTDSDADYICRKVLNMRLFPNDISGKGWDLNVMQRNYEVLLVSQFTLYGFLKGNKPDFHVAMPPQRAKPFYASLVHKFRQSYNPDAIKDGVFGAMMKVNLINDGPVTMQLDSLQSPKNTTEVVEES